AATRYADRFRRRPAASVGAVRAVVRIDRGRGHWRSRRRCRTDRGRVYPRPGTLGAFRARAISLAASAVEASASRHATRVGRSAMSRATSQLFSDKRAWFGGGTIVLLIVLAVGAPLFARHDPFGIDLINSLQAPSAAHWFGTDIQGRDVWARLVYGARVSLSVGIFSQGIALVLGVLLGLVAGYYAGWIDELVMRLADVTLAFPTLLLLIALVAALQPSLSIVFITIGVVGWAGMARLVRGQVLVVRELE